MDQVSKSRDTLLRSRASAVDLQHLRYAVAAADHGSFRRAAEVLLLQQSTLSRCIRQLEHVVGMILFERSSGGVRATEASSDLAGRLTIGFYTSLSAGNLRATLMDYSRRFPDIALHVIESSRTRLITALRNGAIDVAVVTGEVPLPNSKSIPLWSERILVVLPEGHRLAASETIHWTDLKGETLLLSQRDPGSEIQDLLTARLVSPADRPNVVRHDISRESIKSLIGAGFGIGLTLEASLGAIFSGVIHREARDGTGPVRIDQLLGERYPSPSI